MMLRAVLVIGILVLPACSRKGGPRSADSADPYWWCSYTSNGLASGCARTKAYCERVRAIANKGNPEWGFDECVSRAKVFCVIKDTQSGEPPDDCAATLESCENRRNQANDKKSKHCEKIEIPGSVDPNWWCTYSTTTSANACLRTKRGCELIRNVDKEQHATGEWAECVARAKAFCTLLETRSGALLRFCTASQNACALLRDSSENKSAGDCKETE